MSKKDNTYHHYVPFCYLKQFGHKINKDPKEFFVYCFDKINGKTYPKNIRKICGENFFYNLCPESCENDMLNPLSIERDYFAKSVEPHLSKLLNYLNDTAKKCFYNNINTFPSTGNIRFQIAWHFVIQALRLPTVREFEIESSEAVIPKMLDVLKNLVANIEQDSSFKDMDIKVNYDHALIHAQTSFMNSNLIHSFVKGIYDKFWAFMYSPKGEFMTCDCPILVKQHIPDARPIHLGLSQYGSELFFVISPYLAIHLLDKEYFEFPKDKDDFVFGESTEDGIKRINLLNFCLAQRYIINHNNNFSFIKQLYNTPLYE